MNTINRGKGLTVEHHANYMRFRAVTYAIFTAFMIILHLFFKDRMDYRFGIAALAVAGAMTPLYLIARRRELHGLYDALVFLEIANCGVIYFSLNFKFNPAVICFMPVFLFCAYRGDARNYYAKALAAFTVFAADLVLVYRFRPEVFHYKAGVINLAALLMTFGACAVMMHESNREERMIGEHYKANISTRRRLRGMNDELADSLKEINAKLSMTFMNIITTLVKILESRDRYTMGHSERVTKFALGLASAINMVPARRTAVRYGGMFHDIGKLAIPDRVLMKPDTLDEDEFHVMRTHTTIGRRILSSISAMDGSIVDICHYHHERIDGRGYPRGLRGEQIPIEARIMGVADTFEAMTSDRCYRAAMPVERAIDELREHAGTQLDRELSHLFIDMVERGEFND